LHTSAFSTGSHDVSNSILDENLDALEAFRNGRDATLPWSYGLEITRLVMASYMSAEKKKVIDLTDPNVIRELETFIPLVQQGRGLTGDRQSVGEMGSN
jgi:hypothetical protein